MKNQKRNLYCSTGTMVGKLNGYNYKRAISEIARLSSEGIIDGAELMSLTYYYDKYKTVAKEIQSAGAGAPIIHCEKGIGTNLSDAALAFSNGDKISADRLYGETMELFRLNCQFGSEAGSSKMVLHLWGGLNSDSHIKYNINALEDLIKISSEFNLKLLIENVPCTTYDPLSNFHRIVDYIGNISFLFDSRFARFHRQTEQILTDEKIFPLIEHVHISDIKGEERDFSTLRPILHPGDGSVDFNKIAALLDGLNYAGTVTLESPVMEGEALDEALLKKSLIYVGKLLCGKNL